jgi:hypothetical protein
VTRVSARDYTVHTLMGLFYLYTLLHGTFNVHLEVKHTFLQNIYSVGLLLLIHMDADEADSSKEANIEHG